MMTKSMCVRLVVIVGLGWTVFAGTPAAFTSVSVVMTGLENPRGLAIGPEGGIYVAEAGHGGAGPCIVVRGAPSCLGPSGALTRLWRGTQERVVSGLPSLISPSGEVVGPNNVSLQGRGGTFVPIGLGANPALRVALGPGGALLGTLVQISASGQVRSVADLAAYEGAINPDGGVRDSNPFGVLAEPGRHLATDAGGNSLLEIAPNGRVTTLAVFPSRSSGRSTDSVPTEVAQGPDGAYYVSELTGVPFTAGAANIYRVVPGQAPTVFLSGFKTIIDLAFGPDGSLYVLEHASGPVFFAGPGRIIRVAPNGSRTVVMGGLDRPTALVIDVDGTIYVTNHGISAGAGEVLKIQP